MSATQTVFRWNFGKDEVALREYAEGALQQIGYVGDRKWHMTVYLVRDELRRPRKKGELLDPDVREGIRIYCGGVNDQDELRLIAHLASEEAERRAYTAIFTAVLYRPDAVEKFGSEWLTRLVGEVRAKDGRSDEVTA